MSQGISTPHSHDDAPGGPAGDALGRAAGMARRWLDEVFSHLGAALLTAIILVVLGGVVSRYVFNASFSWTEEAGLWLFTYLIFVTLPIATRRSRHIALNLAVDLLPPRGQAAVSYTHLTLPTKA